MNLLKLLNIRHWENFGKKKIGIVSLYGNPIHFGHIEYINSSKSKNDILIAIINNDKQVKLKRTIPFMDEDHRRNLINNLKSVDIAMISIDKDKTVCETIKHIKKSFPEEILTFYNSGDRNIKNLESAEVQLCKKLNINYEIIDLPKIYSSSKLISDACSHN